MIYNILPAFEDQLTTLELQLDGSNAQLTLGFILELFPNIENLTLVTKNMLYIIDKRNPLPCQRNHIPKETVPWYLREICFDINTRETFSLFTISQNLEFGNGFYHPDPLIAITCYCRNMDILRAHIGYGVFETFLELKCSMGHQQHLK